MNTSENFEIVSHKEYVLSENVYMNISIVKIDDRLHENKTITRFKYDFNGKFTGRIVDYYTDGKFIDSYNC